MRAIRAEMRRARPSDVSVPQFRALLFIRRHPGTDLSGVAEHLGTSLPAASELVSRLVREALVARVADPSSRRRIRLDLTPSGAAQLETAEARTLAWLRGHLGSTDPERLAAIAAALDELDRLLARDDR
jgi:DNA-binding MarR family transcriptional regulator